MATGIQIVPKSAAGINEPGWLGGGGRAAGMPELPFLSPYDLAPDANLSSWSTGVSADAYIAQERGRLATQGWRITDVSRTDTVVTMSARRGSMVADLHVTIGAEDHTTAVI